MADKLRLAVDARSAQYRGSGVASYSLGLINSLSAVSDLFDYVFVADSHLPTGHIDFPPNSQLIYTPVARSNWALRDVWEQVLLPLSLARHRVSLFHGFDYVVPVGPVPFARVVTFHDAAVFTPLDGRPRLAKLRVQLLMKVVAARADAIITDSDYSRREIERYLPASRQKTHRIWVGIAETFFTPAEPGAVGPCLAKARVSDGFILYYGGFAEHKNVDLLLRAFALLRKTRKQRLVLVGAAGRSTGGGLDRTVDALGISDSTTVFGFASEAELKILLDNCSLFVCPSAHEGFGLPVAEAMARGAPVVCSTHGSLPEIAGDAVVYFEGGTPRHWHPP